MTTSNDEFRHAIATIQKMMRNSQSENDAEWEPIIGERSNDNVSCGRCSSKAQAIIGEKSNNNISRGRRSRSSSSNTKNIPLVLMSILLLIGAVHFWQKHHINRLHLVCKDKENKTTLLPRIPPIRDVCFIHIGKTGGESISLGLHALQSSGSIGGVVQIHSHKDKERHWADYITPSDEAAAILSASSSSPIPGKKYPWGEFSGAATMVRQYRQYGGPLSNVTRNGSRYCPMTGHVVIWVRDPVGRLIGLWNFAKIDSKKSQANLTRSTDLNTLVEEMADKESREGNETGFAGLFDILHKIEHATLDLSFYLGNKQQKHPTVWGERSTTCKPLINSLPIWFIGRTEHMNDDWESFLNMTVDPRFERTNLPHTHKSGREGKILSRKSVDFLRKFYKTDYDCLQDLVKLGFLDEDYFYFVTSETHQYQY